MLTCQHFWDIGYEVGLYQTIVSRVFNIFVCILLQHHGWKLYNNLEFFEPKLAAYNRKFMFKIQSGGDLVPPSVEHVSYFTDGTRKHTNLSDLIMLNESSIIVKTRFIAMPSR